LKEKLIGHNKVYPPRGFRGMRSISLAGKVLIGGWESCHVIPGIAYTPRLII